MNTTLFSRKTGLDEAVARWIGGLALDSPFVLDGLEVHPLLLRERDPGPPFTLLADAIRAGTLTAEERGAGGQVNEVVVTNRGDAPVLVLEGETIVGAKQNRVVVADVLIPPGSMLAVPVGCVERGRWRRTSSAFDAGEAFAEPMMRLATALERKATGHVNQARLWQAIEGRLAETAAESETSDYHLWLEKKSRRAKQRAEALAPRPGQVGVMALAGGVLLGLDLLGHPHEWESVAERLVPSYLGLAEARDPRAGAGMPAAGWLEAVAAAPLRSGPARGMGVQFEFADGPVSGGGLWAGARPAHLSAFASERPEDRSGPRDPGGRPWSAHT